MVPLLVIFTILAFLAVDLLVQRVQASRAMSRAETEPLAPRGEALDWQIHVPEGLFVSPGHAWAAVEPSGKARVGMDDFVCQMLGTPDTIDLPRLGIAVKTGDPLVTLYKGRSLAHLASPLDGVVQGVHLSMADEPARGTKDPYGEGWLVALKPTNLSRNLAALRIGDSAKEFLAGETEKFKGFIASHEPAMAIAADGGKPVLGIVPVLGPEIWERFRKEFLREEI